jgi:hypothetical protein
VSIVWAAAGRPEYGDLAARLEYFHGVMSSNRVGGRAGAALRDACCAWGPALHGRRVAAACKAEQILRMLLGCQ